LIASRPSGAASQIVAGLNVRSNDLKAISALLPVWAIFDGPNEKPLAVFSVNMTTIVYVRALNVRALIKGK
jgi:hypothetical protein